MGIGDRARVLAFLKENAPPETASIAEQRARMDTLADFFPVPEGTVVEPATLCGVPGVWVRARRARNDAALLYLHGGGYMIGSPKAYRHLAAALSEDSGLALFVPDYRLAPEHPFPAALEDAVAAYKGLIDYGLPSGRLAIAGDSAGGGLTIAALVSVRDRGFSLPACAVALSPWMDLSQGGEAHRARAARDPMLTKEELDRMAAAYLAGKDPRTPLASPWFADLSGLPPLLLQVGTEESLYDDTAALKRRAEEAGVEVSAESWGGMIHVWHIFHPILSEGRDAIRRVGSYLKARIE